MGSKSEYRGTFYMNKKHGFGIEEHAYKSYFIGEYKDGKRHGRITFYNHPNSYNQVYVNGYLVSSEYIYRTIEPFFSPDFIYKSRDFYSK